MSIETVTRAFVVVEVDYEYYGCRAVFTVKDDALRYADGLWELRQAGPPADWACRFKVEEVDFYG